MSDGNMTYENWLRGCVHHDGRHGYVTLPCDEVLKIADFIERLRADLKTENSSEKPNNCEDEPQNDAKRCITCKYNPWVSKACREYKGGICDNYEPQADCDGCQHYADKHTADACYECRRSYTDCYVPQTERNE